MGTASEVAAVVASAPPLAQVRDFHKVYRQTEAVLGLSFDVRPGEVLGLIGPNGAGKTTTLRALAGIIPPSQGELLVAGHNVVRDPIAAKRELAYVPVDPQLFDTLTVREHLEFVAATYRLTDWKPRAEELLAQFDLLDKGDTVCQELSRGMRQKVTICCAYLHNPRLILFDEPLTGLDPKGIRNLKDSVVTQARRGAAVIISSHLLNLVEDLCTHLLLLHHGQRLFFGPIAEIRTAFVDVHADASLEELFLKATSQPRTN